MHTNQYIAPFYLAETLTGPVTITCIVTLMVRPIDPHPPNLHPTLEQFEEGSEIH